MAELARRVGLSLVPGSRAAIKRIVRRNHLVIDVVSHLQGGTVFLDASKDPNRFEWLKDARP